MLRSATGAFTRTRARRAIETGNLEVHWPEGNVLLVGRGASIPNRCEPDYNAVVTIEAADG